MANELLFKSISDVAPLLRSRKLSPVELTRLTLDRIDSLDKRLNSYITVMGEAALADAAAAEKEIVSGKYRGPLHGIPISIKDMFATRGVRTTCGSKVLADWVPDHDATAVARLRAAGAVIVGKTNMHEFAYGVTSDNQFYGAVHNPWDLKLVPGGSSGGSGAAVASGLCFASLGSDTGGSIRIPSAVCGTVGLKPTYGRVSRYGAIPLAWSIDHVGPLARTVADAALMLLALAGADPHDKTSSPRPVPDYSAATRGSIRGLRVGVPQQYFFEHVDPEIEAAVHAAIAKLEILGAHLVPVSLPHLDLCSPAEAHITLAEATSYHEPYMRSNIDLYGPGVRTDLEAGRYLLATDYVKSQRARTLLKRVFGDAFKNVDVIASPTLPAFPPVIGDVYVQSGDAREAVIDAFLRFAIPYNLTGLPALTMPCGYSRSGLPIGFQVAGKPFDEMTLIRVGHAYEGAVPEHRRPLLD
jgi:aspartyl-tRNA(Asn)/glutamyl-tRNA(Gln) amidotransferase subunit A